MRKLDLEVGKTYHRRDGTKSSIAYRIDELDTHPFVDEDGHTYAPDGRFLAGGGECLLDLIKEVPRTVPFVGGGNGWAAPLFSTIRKPKRK